MEEKNEKFETRAGFCAVLGLPNVGKSTLVNSLVGEKVLAVSPKAQTSRYQVRCILTRGDTQIIFIDTPGLLKPENQLHKRMEEEIKVAVNDADLMLALVEFRVPLREEDITVLQNPFLHPERTIVAGTKKDLVRNVDPMLFVQSVRKIINVENVLATSAITGEGLEELFLAIRGGLKSSPFLYGEDDMIDRSIRFVIQELVREKFFTLLSDELPYSIAVIAEKIEEKDDILDASVTVYVERDSQKGIIIGKGGSVLKKAGTAARMELEALLGKKVNLKLWVKVWKNWKKDAAFLDKLGFSK